MRVITAPFIFSENEEVIDYSAQYRMIAMYGLLLECDFNQPYCQMDDTCPQTPRGRNNRKAHTFETLNNLPSSPTVEIYLARELVFLPALFYKLLDEDIMTLSYFVSRF